MRAEGKNINSKVMKYYRIIQAVVHLNYGTFSICGCLKGKPHEVRIGHVQYSLKGHGNEADFLGFLQKSFPHESLTLPFEPFRFSLRIRRVGGSTRLPIRYNCFKTIKQRWANR